MASLDKDTFDGWLVVMMKNIGEAKMRFPGEAPWLIKLETAVLSKSQDPTRKLQELGLTPGDPGGGMGAPGGGMPPMPPGAMAPGGMGAPPPTMGGPPMPDPAMVAQLMGGGGAPPMGGPPMGPPPGPPPGPPMM